MSYSNSTGGTLTLPSPTNVHHVDVRAAVRSLRRSLSRSPSKFNLLRSSSDSSDAPAHSANSPHSPSSQPPLPPLSSFPSQNPSSVTCPASPSPFSAQALCQSQQTIQFPTQQPQSVATPFRSSVKLSLRSARPKAQSAKPLSRTRPSPRSPLKRALSSSNDAGNATSPAPPAPPATSPASIGQENSFHSFALAFGQSARSSLGKAGSRHSMHLDLSGSSKAASSNGSRFLDVKSETYPSATASPLKRTDPIMTTDALGSPVAKRRSLHGIASFGSDLGFLEQMAPAPRSSFEIHEDANQEYKLIGSSLLSASREAALSSSPVPNSSLPKRSSSLRKSTLQQRHDPRTSWGKRQGERYLAQQSHETSSPVQRSKHQRASLDQFMQPDPRESPFSARGPLPSASAHIFDRPAHQPHPLSRTLTTASLTTSSSSSSVADESPTHAPPPAADRMRPPPTNFARSLPVGAHPPTNPVATPSYKSARPLQSAFASTGLVSKMNRNPEAGPMTRSGHPQMMPDTPCKKQFSFESSLNYPHNTYPPSSGSSRKQRFSLGNPSRTPYSPAPAPVLGDLGSLDRSAGGLFKPRSSNGRRSNFFSFDNEFNSLIPDDADLPPTPTKQALVSGKSMSAGAVSTTSAASRAVTPTASLFGRRVAGSSADLSSSPLQQHGGLASSESPKTPRDSMMPPDASRLSISNAPENSATRRAPTYPPATPTTVGGRTSLFGVPANRAITPVNGHGFKDIDVSLAERFTNIESIGYGEFSEVFRVSGRPSQDSFAIPNRSGTPGTPPPERLYAVKKLRHPFTGMKDREAKRREVDILKALQNCDNILQYVADWEWGSRLYVQTEYCDNGSLEKFLSTVGFPGRMDDFRIWKILLEIVQGLSHIHESGFIHLDIKPANIMIAFDGTLKIGDFGLASTWPAPKYIDGEGDRAYIGPEILRGQFDKPADVYALGLITFEAASNSILPNNGEDWVAIRERRLSDFPQLTLQESELEEAQFIRRDATEVSLQQESSSYGAETVSLDLDLHTTRSGIHFGLPRSTHDASNLFGAKRAPSYQAQPWMKDRAHPGSLDTIVNWMIAPEPSERPTVQEILSFPSVRWVSDMRLASATIFEGNWGPIEKVCAIDRAGEDKSLSVDVEMMDV